MPSVVVDTTVLISGFLTPEGVAGQLLGKAKAGAFNLCLSREIIEELRSMVIACGLGARADYIVTRDKDLLSLGAHEGIRIVTPRQFLDLLEQSGIT